MCDLSGKGREGLQEIAANKEQDVKSHTCEAIADRDLRSTVREVSK